MSAAVEAQAVGRRYGPVTAVEDLTFAVEAGEILGVLGPNGAGKTTAIRVLTTILRADAGRRSRSPESPPLARPRSAVGSASSPRAPATRIARPARSTSAITRACSGTAARSARAVADELLVEVGLHERRRSLIAGYSRGMRQRLGIARALVNGPRWSSSTSRRSASTRPASDRCCRRCGGSRAERGATVLLSTHLLAEVEETCSRVLILNRGRVVAEGTVAEITRRAAAPRSATLQVAPDQAERAAELLRAVAGVAAGARCPDDRPGCSRSRSTARAS